MHLLENRRWLRHDDLKILIEADALFAGGYKMGYLLEMFLCTNVNSITVGKRIYFHIHITYELIKKKVH